MYDMYYLHDSDNCISLASSGNRKTSEKSLYAIKYHWSTTQHMFQPFSMRKTTYNSISKLDNV